MLDLLYVGGTVVFFTAMVGYLAACQRLGHRSNQSGEPSS